MISICGRDARIIRPFFISGIRPDTRYGNWISGCISGKQHSPIIRLHMTSANLMWSFVIPSDLIWPQPTSWYLSRPTSCDLSLPYGTPATLLWPQLSSGDFQWSHQPFCGFSCTFVTLADLIWPYYTSHDLSRPPVTSFELCWPVSNLSWSHLTPCDLMKHHVRRCNLM